MDKQTTISELFSRVQLTIDTSSEGIETELQIAREINEKIAKLNLANLINNTILHKSIKKMKFLGKGNFGIVYKNKNGTVVKFSHILKKINEYIFKNRSVYFDTSDFMYEFDNELEQIKTFSELKILFPQNFIEVYNTELAYIENIIFPVNVSNMEYIDGISLGNFLDNFFGNKPKFDYSMFLNFVCQCIKILMSVNLLGYFHNDLNLKNIMVVFVTGKPVPILIDYSFSKKIPVLGLFPIECSIWINQIKHYVGKHKNINFLKFDELHEIIHQINTKYCIYETVFVERLIVGSGIFTYNDYLTLPVISQEDIDILTNSINKLISE